MALIKCLECGKEISDKASACPNCGCPIEKGKAENVCSINGIKYNLTEELNLIKSSLDGTEVALKLCSKCDLHIKDAIELYQIIQNEGTVPEIYVSRNANCIPHCPTCNSSSVEKISVGKKIVGGAMFGVLSSDVRASMYCKNCGYKW